MNPTLEIKALGLALLAACLSLGGAWLAAKPIRLLANSMGTPQVAEAPADAGPVAVATPEVIQQGQQMFSMSCTECHGDDAHGDEGPDLHNLAISNARIASTIRRGVKGEMPSFTKQYDDTKIVAIVSYLRTLH